jgi:branched-chain amino acid transport system permease protein
MRTPMKSLEPQAGPLLSFWRGVLLDWDKVQLLLSLLLILLFGLSPLLIHSPYYLGIIILTVIYAYVGLAWNIVGGFAGQLLIGHVTFFGLGAYTTILLFELFRISPWIGIPLSAIPSAFLGLIISFLTLRYGLRLDYFALFTLAIMVILSIVFSQLTWAGGAQGIWVTYRGVSLRYMMFKDKLPYLYIGLALLLMAVIFTYKIYRSKTGKYLVAIREDEAAAAALGVDTARYKTIALLITAAMEGIGGGFYVIYTTLVEPPLVFNLALNVELLTAPLIGGLGTIIGPLLGAILNKPTVEILRGSLQHIRAGSTLIVYGSFLIVFILFLPRGVAGLVQDFYMKLRRSYVARLSKEG